MTTCFTLNLQVLVTAAALAASAIGANGVKCFGQPASRYVVDHVCDISAPTSVDSDGDGVCDHDDAFPQDPCESVDVGGKKGANVAAFREMLISMSKLKIQKIQKPWIYDCGAATQGQPCCKVPHATGKDMSGHYGPTFEGYRDSTWRNSSAFQLEWSFEFEGRMTLAYEYGSGPYRVKSGIDGIYISDQEAEAYLSGIRRTCPAVCGTGYQPKNGDGRIGQDSKMKPFVDYTPGSSGLYEDVSDIRCKDDVCHRGFCMADAHFGVGLDPREPFGGPERTFGSKCFMDLYAEMLAKYGNERGNCHQGEYGWTKFNPKEFDPMPDTLDASNCPLHPFQTEANSNQGGWIFELYNYESNYLKAAKCPSRGGEFKVFGGNTDPDTSSDWGQHGWARDNAVRTWLPMRAWSSTYIAYDGLTVYNPYQGARYGGHGGARYGYPNADAPPNPDWLAWNALANKDDYVPKSGTTMTSKGGCTGSYQLNGTVHQGSAEFRAKARNCEAKCLCQGSPYATFDWRHPSVEGAQTDRQLWDKACPILLENRQPGHEGTNDDAYYYFDRDADECLIEE